MKGQQVPVWVPVTAAAVSVPIGMAAELATQTPLAVVDLLVGVVLAGSACFLAFVRTRGLALLVAVGAIAWFIATLIPEFAAVPRVILSIAVLGAPRAFPQSRRARVALIILAACALPWIPVMVGAAVTAIAVLVARPRAAAVWALSLALAASTLARVATSSRADLALVVLYAGIIAVGPLLVGQVLSARRRVAARAIDISSQADPASIELLLDAAAGDHVLRDRIAAGRRLVAENVELQQTLEAQATEIQVSNRRLVTAADRQRAALARRIHDGPGKALIELEPLVRGLPDARRLLGEAQRDVATLSRGLLPEAVARGDMAAALSELAGDYPILMPHYVDARPLPFDAASAVWFVVAEGVANSVKHANAGQIEVHVGSEGNSVVVRVLDDGVGGADPEGAGLTGIADRVVALGGTFAVASTASGTELLARIPIA